MFNVFKKEVQAEEISREELNEIRAARITEAMPNVEEYAEPLRPIPYYNPSNNDKVVASGTGLIKGIEFEMDTVPVEIPGDGHAPVNIPIPTIYPPINAYIGNVMNFQEVHDYNNAQDIYYQNSSKILFAERVNFLMNNIIEEFRIYLKSILFEMKKDAKEITVKAGRNCRECEGDYLCSDCPGNKYVNIYTFVSSRDIVQLLPQLIDIDFYNTIKATGGIESNKELLEITSMAFAAILLNKINIETIDEVSHAEAMIEVNKVVQLSATRLGDMITAIIKNENIINLVDYNGNYMWRPGLSSNQIADKL